MSAVDFAEWAAPPLKITLGGRTYVVQPPSVADAALLLASAARGEVVLGFTKRPLPPELQTLLDEMPPDHHPALGPVWNQMRTDGLPQMTIDRMAYYATFYWARGKEYADTVAQLLWAPRTGDSGGDPDAPKA